MEWTLHCGDARGGSCCVNLNILPFLPVLSILLSRIALSMLTLQLCTESSHAPINACTRYKRILYRGKGRHCFKTHVNLVIVFSFLNLKISFSNFTEQFLYKVKMYFKILINENHISK